MIAWAIFCYSLFIISGLFLGPIGWLFSLGVVIYLIYEVVKHNLNKITTKAHGKVSYLEKGSVRSKGKKSIKRQTSESWKIFSEDSEKFFEILNPKYKSRT